MAEETVDITSSDSGPPPADVPRSLPALILLWCRDEPERVGELVLLLNDPDTGVLLGRSSTTSSGARAEFVRQLPGRNEVTGAFHSKTISRDQFRLTPLQQGAIKVENLGRGTLSKGGQQAPSHVLAPGELVLLERRVLFMASVRPLTLQMPGLHASGHSFGDPDSDGLVGESPALWELRARLAFVAQRNSHVLVTGASGTGKELVAQALHSLSARRRNTMVARNAATIPDTLADAELFGNLKNYPNPGTPERAGLIGSADGSTLFLDEFAELPEAVQAKLLRVLDNGEFQRLGDAQARVSKFRLVAATNRPLHFLKHDVRARFKMQLDLPGLNARREDIPLLTRFLLRRIAHNDSQLAERFFPDGDVAGQPRISAALISALVEHAYSTHVRELEGLLWQALAQARGDTIEVFPGFGDAEPAAGSQPATGAGAAPAAPAKRDGDWSAEELQACLDKHNGSQEPVWRELGMSSRFVLSRLVRKYGLRVRGRKG